MRRELLGLLAALGMVSVLPLTAQSTPVVTNGLIAAWEFNGNANDSSGNGNHGTPNGVTLTPDRFGVANHAYSFDGSGDFIVVPDADMLDPAGSFTITFWANVAPSSSPSAAIIGKHVHGTDSDGSWMIFSNGTTFSNYSGNNATRDLPSLTPAAFDSWAFVAFTFDQSSGGWNFYSNGGEPENSGAAASFDFRNTAKSLYIGQEDSGGLIPFTGILDDIFIYDRVLTPAEIQLLSIPEPSTTLLIGCGLVGMAIRRRRQRPVENG